MALCFAAFGAATGSLFAALIAHVPSLLGRVGLAFLLAAGVGLAMASRFPMDAVSTPRVQMVGHGTPPNPSMPITNRRFVVDTDIGAVVALSRFSVNRLPDSHLFRVEKGRLRYVHTMTVCLLPNCGFTVRPPAPRTP